METLDVTAPSDSVTKTVAPAALAMLSPQATVAPLFDFDSLDHARGRARVRGAFLLEVGEMFDAELRVDGAPPTRLAGRVVDLHRGTQPGMQVAFENITPAARDALAQLGAATR